MATSDSSARDAYRDFTAQRLLRSRERASRQKRITLLVVALLLALLVLLVWWRAPRAPQLVVTWPNPQKYGQRVLDDGATVLLRSGQPFSVSVPNAADWDLSGSTKDTVVKGERITWSPTESSSTLEVRCRPVANGLARLVSWIWPTRVVRLNGTTGVTAGQSRVHLVPEPGSPVWLSSQVMADSAITWDERVIPLLQFVAPRSGNGSSGQPYWVLTNSFGESLLKGDEGTYARLAAVQAGASGAAARSANAGRIEETLATIARQIAGRSPKASIKFIARYEQEKSDGVLRLAFDGTAARGGWVRQNGQASPFFWWEDLASVSPSSTLQPSLPRTRR
ncbi:MAG TPA: hypothetical protein VF600_00370 [Abditibacteriaceae bacterium]|jgi:hypothetical protein